MIISNNLFTMVFYTKLMRPEFKRNISLQSQFIYYKDKYNSVLILVSFYISKHGFTDSGMYVNYNEMLHCNNLTVVHQK